MEARAPGDITVAVLSDIHYAGAAEQARGENYEFRAIANPLLRVLVRLYRHHIWMRHPFWQGRQFDRFLADVGPCDYVVANGDYSCDSGFVGVSDSAALESARECLEKLRARFGDRVRFTMGDHELGKPTLFGSMGEMRVASWHCAVQQLGLQSFWQLDIGRYILIGLSSSLIALPAMRPETRSEEWPQWEQLREAHLAEIRAAFDGISPDRRILLFCHDPTALPFLAGEDAVRRRLPQIEQTIIGHLHTRLVLWKSRVLSGIPPVHFLGRHIEKFTSALNEAHHWWAFRVRLCPALSGTQLLNDGGYFMLDLDTSGARPARFRFRPLPR